MVHVIRYRCVLAKVTARRSDPDSRAGDEPEVVVKGRQDGVQGLWLVLGQAGRDVEEAVQVHQALVQAVDAQVEACSSRD